MSQWVILVGGMGTRLGALTAETPKPLLPVGGQPFLHSVFDYAAACGATELVLLAGYRAEKVVGPYDGTLWQGIPVRCVVEPEPLGTGGALRFAAAFLRDQWTLVNGDSLFLVDPDCLDHPGTDWEVSMALKVLPDTARSGVVTLEAGRVTGFRPRGDGGPGLMNAGVYRMRRPVLERIPQAGPCSLEADVFPRLAEAGVLRGTVGDGYFIDIGIPEDYQRSQQEVPHAVSCFVNRGSL